MHTSTDQKQVFHPCTLIYRCNWNAKTIEDLKCQQKCVYVLSLCPIKALLVVNYSSSKFETLHQSSKLTWTVIKIHLPLIEKQKHLGAVCPLTWFEGKAVFLLTLSLPKQGKIKHPQENFLGRLDFSFLISCIQNPGPHLKKLIHVPRSDQNHLHPISTALTVTLECL